MSDDPTHQVSTTSYEPSPLDAEKARTVNMLRGVLFPALTPDLAGAMTSRSQAGIDTINKKGINSSVKSGMQKGDIGMLSNMATGKGDNNSALNMALQMYGYGGVGAGASSKTKNSPSATQIGAAIGGAGGGATQVAKQLYDYYNKPSFDTNFDYNAWQAGNYSINAPTELTYGATPTTGPAASYGVMDPTSIVAPTELSMGASGGLDGILGGDMMADAAAAAAAESASAFIAPEIGSTEWLMALIGL